MLIRAGARHVPQALDPARHARRDPRPGPAEDQLRLRVRRREARRAHGRGPARDRRRPGRDHRLRRLSQASSTRSAASTSTCRPRSARRSPDGAFNLEARRGREPPRRLPGDHPRPHPRRTPAARASSPAPTSSGPQFQQLILDGIKGKLTSITCAAAQLHQGPADRLERAEGDGLEHGRADDAAARDLGGDRRRRHRRAQAVEHDRRRQPGRLAGGVRARGREAARRRAAAQARTARRAEAARSEDASLASSSAVFAQSWTSTRTWSPSRDFDSRLRLGLRLRLAELRLLRRRRSSSP